MAADWEGVPAPKRRRSEKRRLDAIVSVRFTPTEVDELRRRCARMGMSMSGYLRHLATTPSQNYSNDNPGTVTVAGPVFVHYPEAS